MSFQIPCMRTELDRTLNQLLSDKRFAYLEIQEFLCVYHQKTIGLPTIKRPLQKLNLFRHPVERIRTDDATLLAAVREELVAAIQYWIQESLGSHTKNGLKRPTRGCSPGYFTVRFGWSVKKKTKKTETEKKVLQCWTKLLLEY